jgi:molecular chaperone GrpE
MLPDDPLDPPPHDQPHSPDEAATRSRLAEAQLEQAMDGYHTLRAENETLRDQLDALQKKHRTATQDIGASLARQKRAAARELQIERETIYTRYIEILDNFDRAFDSPEARAASHSLMEGFILVRNQVVQVLRDGGFDRVRTLGLPYDPNTSEAIEVVDVEDPTQDGVVIRELVRGYRLNEHVVRAARVVVGRCVSSPKEDTGETVTFAEVQTGEMLGPAQAQVKGTSRTPEDQTDEARTKGYGKAEND